VRTAQLNASSGECGFKPTSHVQPYSTLVLADLIYARGAQDEGIAVLAEWLTKHKDIKCQSGQKKDKSLSCWWALRVESRIHLWMADVAGQNNVAYRTFINSYNEDLKEYFGKIDKKSEPTSASPRPHRVVSLDGLHAKCKMWEENRPNRKTKKESLSNSVGWRGASFAIAHDSGADNRQNTNDQQNDQQQNEQDVTTEQKAYFLLLEAEDESLRTELNFVGEESAFDELEDLYRRAAFLATVGPECLPTFDFDLSEPMIADHLVTVGLIGLTVADRMHTLARSRGDHDHATEIAREAEHFLRLGSAELNKRVAHDREKIKNNKDLYARIFSQSDWEKSANLAARAMIRLRTKE
jgi:hypothetical protein